MAAPKDKHLRGGQAVKQISKSRAQRQASAQYPGYRVDITGPHSAVITSEDGSRKRITFRRRITTTPPIMRTTLWLVPVAIWCMAMLIIGAVVMAAALGIW